MRRGDAAEPASMTEAAGGSVVGPSANPRFRCHACGVTFVAWAPAERHGNERGHGRIETLLRGRGK